MILAKDDCRRRVTKTVKVSRTALLVADTASRLRSPWWLGGLALALTPAKLDASHTAGLRL